MRPAFYFPLVLFLSVLLNSTTQAQHFQFSKLFSVPSSPLIPSNPPTEPEWYSTLSQEHHDYIAKLLWHWEKKSQLKFYQCEFTRFDYSSALSLKNAKTNELMAYRISSGNIVFADPARVLYEVTKSWTSRTPEKPNAEPPYEPIDPEESKERWLFDGRTFYNFDFRNKKVYKVRSPNESQGEELMDLLLPPFIIHAKADDLLTQYWIRIVTPEKTTGEYWMEAIPKLPEVALRHKKLIFVISEEDFLLHSLEIYGPSYDEKNHQLDRMVYAFKSRQQPTDKTRVAALIKRFDEPTIPNGWNQIKIGD